MSDVPHTEEEILTALESNLGTAELTAFLSEWITTNVHRCAAFALVLGSWREGLIGAGYSGQAVEDTLPLMMTRLWPEALTFTFTGEETNDDDDSDD